MKGAVLRGTGDLRRLLEQRTRDLRELDFTGFRRWLEDHCERWRRDPVFSQCVRIRELRRAVPRLIELEREERAASEADATSPVYARLSELERTLKGVEQAIHGLREALRDADPEKREALQEKLNHFMDRKQVLTAELESTVGSSPSRQRLLKVREELARLRARTGLEEEERHLAELTRRQGRHSGRSGSNFEDVAARLARELIFPELEGRGLERGELHLLRGVALGAARTEFDQVVVRRVGGAELVEVLAVVEVKRNPNDLAKGFRQRQENLAWLTGDVSGYIPESYRTRHFATGHFDRPAEHRERGESFVLTRESFRRFHVDPATGWRLDGVYLVTRARTLWGISSAGLSRIGFRVATDPRWDPQNEAYLGELRRWCRSLTEEVESPDILRMYAAAGERARQVIVVSSP